MKTDRDKLAAKIVRAVFADLFDRRGFRQEWDGCDEEIKKEIRRSLTGIVAAHLPE